MMSIQVSGSLISFQSMRSARLFHVTIFKRFVLVEQVRANKSLRRFVPFLLRFYIYIYRHYNEEGPLPLRGGDPDWAMMKTNQFYCFNRLLATFKDDLKKFINTGSR